MKRVQVLFSLLSLLGGMAFAQDAPIDCSNLSNDQLQKASSELTVQELKSLARECEDQSKELVLQANGEANSDQQKELKLRGQALSAEANAVILLSAAIGKDVERLK